MLIHPDDKAGLPSREILRSLLEYDPETGSLTWKARALPLGWSTRWAGKPALNCTGEQGYLRGRLLGRYVYAHRVIFKLMTGLEPPQIDHDDGCRSNNRWSNLFAATALDNARNVATKCCNKSGRTGVFQASNGRWIAQIRNRSKPRHLGSFVLFSDAVAAREAAEREIGFRAR